jgi:uncharacterized RDD family membrane protein YckC
MDQKTCPNCQSTDLDAAGVCLTCGFIPAETAPDVSPAHEEAQDVAAANEYGEETSTSSMIEMDYSSPDGDAESPDLPEWRVELSRRLQEIKQKREAAVAGEPARLSPEHSSHEVELPRETGHEAPKVAVASVRTPRKPPRVIKTPASPDAASTPKRQPAKSTHEPDLPLFQPRRTEQPEIFVVGEPDPNDIRELIDIITARQAACPSADEPAPHPTVPASRMSVPLEDRLMLVSRTLSGLVDLIVVTVCTGGCIITADVISGISIFDWKSLIVYSLLLAAMFFSYSVFFLGTASQTIGMMLTNLKVVSEAESRPGVRQLFGRCFAYLLSLSLFGLGLLWGLWDRKGQCLHDRLSHTRVVRL